MIRVESRMGGGERIEDRDEKNTTMWCDWTRSFNDAKMLRGVRRIWGMKRNRTCGGRVIVLKAISISLSRAKKLKREGTS